MHRHRPRPYKPSTDCSEVRQAPGSASKPQWQLLTQHAQQANGGSRRLLHHWSKSGCKRKSVRRKAERPALLAQLCLLLARPASPSSEVNHRNGFMSMALGLCLLQTLSKEHRKQTSLLNITLGITRSSDRDHPPPPLTTVPVTTGARMLCEQHPRASGARNKLAASRASEGQRGLSSSGERQASCKTPPSKDTSG